MLSSHRGVIDIILGDVLVVVARFFATAVVTLRCNLVSDIVESNEFRDECFNSQIVELSKYLTGRNRETV